MSEILWKIGSEERLREHIIAQDKRFQSVMRGVLGMPEPAKPKRRVMLAPPKPVEPPKEQPRDVIDLVTNAKLLRQPTPWKRIVEEVCIAHQVSKPELLGSQRERRIVLARHEAMYRMKTETVMSLPQIGRRLGGKDHTTVLHGIRCHEARMVGQVYRQKVGRVQ